MFPSPIGGIALPSEVGPAIIFAILYGLLLPLVIFRIWDRRSRTFLLFGTSFAVLDRIVVFSLRAVATQRASYRFSNTLLRYTQISFGLGFVAIVNDVVNLLRCVLVNPTFGFTDDGHTSRYDESPASHTKDVMFEAPTPADIDQPELRAQVRRYGFWLSMAFLASSVPGNVAAGWYKRDNFADERKGDRLYKLRYASTAVGLFLILVTVATAEWSRRHQPRACRKALNLAIFLASLMGIVAIYRLSVMHFQTSAFSSTAAGTLNSPGAKASFYLLHIVPEYIAVASLLVINTRKVFGTGPCGDWRGRDDSEKAIKKRHAKKAKKDAKKARRAGGDEEKNGSSIPLRTLNLTSSSLIMDGRIGGISEVQR